jgi:hypothetical protein
MDSAVVSEPFRQTDQQLTKRFNQLGQRINRELGLRQVPLRFKAFDDRTGVTVWRLEDTSDQQLLTDMSAQLAIAADEGAELQFYLAEHWFRKGKSFQFRSANLRFALFTSEPHALPLYFRLEWAARLPDSNGSYVFTGKGSAHPHWQFDGDLRALTFDPSDSEPGEIIDIELEPKEQSVDLEAGVDATVTTVTTDGAIGLIPWFHRLHLPARAMWAEQLCTMPDEASPQQHEPSNSTEIDNWIISALRYMRHEFSQYSA